MNKGEVDTQVSKNHKKVLKPKRAIEKPEKKSKEKKEPAEAEYRYCRKYTVSYPDPSNKTKKTTTDVICTYRCHQEHDHMNEDDIVAKDDIFKAANRVANLPDSYGRKKEAVWDCYPRHKIIKDEEMPDESAPDAHLHVYDTVWCLTNGVKFYVKRVDANKNNKKED